jgi:hypothetical protein
MAIREGPPSTGKAASQIIDRICHTFLALPHDGNTTIQQETSMRHLRGWLLLWVAGGTLALTACAAAQAPAKTAQAVSGWYSQSAGSATFQPCGTSEPWLVTKAADLSARATAFGLQNDMPIYVKIVAAISASGKYGSHGEYSHQVQVERVIQFGSPTPVRNCALNGVVHTSQPSATQSR